MSQYDNWPCLENPNKINGLSVGTLSAQYGVPVVKYPGIYLLFDNLSCYPALRGNGYALLWLAVRVIAGRTLRSAVTSDCATQREDRKMYIKVINSKPETVGIAAETAIAICQQVGITGLASKSKKSASSLVMQAAVDCQRDKAHFECWEGYVTDTRKAIRSEASASHIQSAGLLKGISGKGDKLSAMMERATRTFDNYAKRIEAAWKAGLVIETAKGADDDSAVPGETLHTLNGRTKAAVEAATPQTTQSKAKARLAELSAAIVALVDSPTIGEGVAEWLDKQMDALNDGLVSLVNALQGKAPAVTETEGADDAAVESLPEGKPARADRRGRRAA